MKEKNHHLSADNGFTFFEVLVALSIMSLSVLILWAGLDRAMSAIEKIHTRNTVIAGLARFEYLFRSEINQLGKLYWESEVEEYESLYMEEETLCMESDDGKILFYNLSLINLETDNHGVEVLLKTELDKEIRIFALFGCYSLVTGDDF